MLLQLDVFHALRELHHEAHRRTRPPGVPARGEREAASREEAIMAYPIGTKVRKEFADIRGQKKVLLGKVYDFSDPYWRVRHPDGYWVELNRQEITRGEKLAPVSA